MWAVTALLLLAALAGGTLFASLFDEDAPLTARLAAGAPIGLAMLALAGFVAASLLGMGTGALVLAGLGAAWPVPVFAWGAARRSRLRADLAAAGRALAHPRAGSLALGGGFLLLAALLGRVFARAMFTTPGGGIATGDDHNLGDLPFHLGIVMGFAEGDNYPPQHPELAGTRLTYPFLADMLTALLLRAGASLEGALFWPNLILAVSLAALLYRWSRLLTGDRLAAAITPVLVLFSGGLGWTVLAGEMAAAEPPWGPLLDLRRDYTIEGDGPLRWGNALTTLLVPQRSMLLGLPLFLTIAAAWWRTVASERDDRQRARLMCGAGIVTGLLPLSHAHSFALALALGGALALLFPLWRAWAAFFAAALAIAAPQLVWSARGSALHASAFLGWHLGWDRGGHHPVWFWLYNTGAFIPLLLGAVAMGRRLPRPLLRFYAPFTLCFLVPNLLRLSPWIWDNIKFLFYWYVASAPLVALLLARMARGRWPARLLAPALVLALVLSGALDVWRVASGRIAHVVFDADAIAFGRGVARATPPGSVIAARPAHDSPVLLSGRPSLLGYIGHIWSQGLSMAGRDQDLANFYAGMLDPAVLRQRYGVDHVVLYPGDIAASHGNAMGWSQKPLVQQGPYRLIRLPDREGILEPH
jgi:hypothetical protein